jgi:hypothetical protein
LPGTRCRKKRAAARKWSKLWRGRLLEIAGLITTLFEHLSLVRGVVLLYFGLLLNELTADKTNLRTPAPLIAATHPARRC